MADNFPFDFPHVFETPTVTVATAAQDAETVIIAWLSTLGACAAERHPGDPLPFRLVTQIAGNDDFELEIAHGLVSVHTMCDASLGRVAARDAADATHNRLRELDRSRAPITISTNRIGVIDYLRPVESPIWTPYTDQILRKTGRYEIGLSYVPTPVG